MRVRPILPALLVVALVALAGCGSAGNGYAGNGNGRGNVAAKPAANSTPNNAGQSSAGGAVTVPANLKFTATTLDGKAFDGASVAGHPVVLWFWAPWCGTCAGQASTVADVAKEYKGKVDIVGVAGMGQEKEMHAFVSDLDVGGITHLSDNAGVIWKRFGITEQSVYVILDRNGKVVSKGWLDSQRFTEQVAKLAAA
jgi:thiol-disulfide isomerase/thioredoxin